MNVNFWTPYFMPNLITFCLGPKLTKTLYRANIYCEGLFYLILQRITHFKGKFHQKILTFCYLLLTLSTKCDNRPWSGNYDFLIWPEHSLINNFIFDHEQTKDLSWRITLWQSIFFDIRPCQISLVSAK